MKWKYLYKLCEQFASDDWATDVIKNFKKFVKLDRAVQVPPCPRYKLSA